MQGKATITIELEGVTPQQLDAYKDAIDTLIIKRVLDIRDGSAELFFDDEGIVQQIIYKTKARKREGQDLVVKPEHAKAGSATGYFDPLGVLQKIVYETQWKRNKPGSIVPNYKSVKITVLTP